MSKESKCNHFSGNFSANTVSIRDKETVTQLTNIGTGVNLTSQAGVIVTRSATAGVQSTQSFTATNTNVKTDSIILTNIIGYDGSTGLPQVYVDDIISGSFKVTIQNNSTSESLNGVLKIGYLTL